MTLIQVFGALLIAAPFIAIFAWSCATTGLIETLTIMLVVVVTVVAIFAGYTLIKHPLTEPMEPPRGRIQTIV